MINLILQSHFQGVNELRILMIKHIFVIDSYSITTEPHARQGPNMLALYAANCFKNEIMYIHFMSFLKYAANCFKNEIMYIHFMTFLK